MASKSYHVTQYSDIRCKDSEKSKWDLAEIKNEISSSIRASNGFLSSSLGHDANEWYPTSTKKNKK
jgi:hypothetical protein